MTHPRPTSYNFVILNIASYITLITFALPTFLQWDDLAHPWWFAFLAATFGVGLVIHQYTVANQLISHMYLGCQTAVIGGLVLVMPNGFEAGILFFILSAQAMLSLPTRQAVVWLGVFSSAVLIAVIAAQSWDDLFGSLAMIGGFSFFGTFGWALRQAEQARLRSQELLEELQLAHTQLQEYAAQAEQLAIAEERNRLAREMHDALGHRLTVAVVQLEGAQRLIPTNPERAASMVGTMREQLKEALAELRQTVATLRTPLTDDLPLATAVTHLAHNFQESTGLQVHLHLPPALPALPAPHRLALYRVAQESLTNIQRHAQATEVWLELQPHNGRLHLTICDNGQGFPTNQPNGRFGLLGLRERAEQLGGQFAWQNRPEGGAQITFLLPIGEAGG